MLLPGLAQPAGEPAHQALWQPCPSVLPSAQTVLPSLRLSQARGS